MKPFEEDLRDWQLSPNPARNEVRFTGFMGMADLDIRDAAGRRVAHYADLPLGPDFVLDVSTWAEGMYLLHLAPGGDAVQGSIRKLFVTH